MSDLTGFLLARIAEDEAWANACEGLHWEWVGDQSDRPVNPEPMLDEYLHGEDEENVSLRSVETFPYHSLPGEGPRFLINTDEVRTVAAGHIARHDPARVLAECEAKRRIVSEFLHVADKGTISTHEPLAARHFGLVDAGYSAVRCLAEVYADHPEYREEWRP